MTVDFDYGCTVTRKKDGLKLVAPPDSWREFDRNRELLLNLVSVEQAIEIINKWQ